MDLKEYQNLLMQYRALKVEYAEIKDKINALGYPNNNISDMPKGSNQDMMDILIDLIDTENIILSEINELEIIMNQSLDELNENINNIKNPRKRRIMRLKYVYGMSRNEISKELDLLPDTVKKILKRN